MIIIPDHVFEMKDYNQAKIFCSGLITQLSDFYITMIEINQKTYEWAQLTGIANDRLLFNKYQIYLNNNLDDKIMKIY